MPDFSDAKKGDEAYHIIRGEGIIIEIRGGSAFPIQWMPKDQMGDAVETFTFDGKEDINDLRPSLFHGPVEIKELPSPKKTKKVKVFVVPYIDTITGRISVNLPAVSTLGNSPIRSCGSIQSIVIEVDDD